LVYDGEAMFRERLPNGRLHVLETIQQGFTPPDFPLPNLLLQYREKFPHRAGPARCRIGGLLELIRRCDPPELENAQNQGRLRLPS
jgi:hypothetical protein